MRNALDSTREQALAHNQQVRELGTAGKVDQAMPILLERAAPATQRWQDAIRTYSDAQRKSSQLAYDQANASMARGRSMLIGGGLAVVLLSALLAWTITRSLTGPLNRATRAAEAIADGKLDNAVHSEASDETGRLLQAMDKMQSQVRNLITAQLDMAERHDSGHISFRMDADAFPGDYGRMAGDTNALVDSHVQVTLRLAQIMGRYAIGDLSEDMDALPGEKARLTDTMAQVKTNLSSMNQQIKQLAQSAADGDFGARGDATQFQFDFRIMVESLNQLMTTADGSLQSLSGILRAIAAGDLTARMDGDFKGCSHGCATMPTPRRPSWPALSDTSSIRPPRSVPLPARSPPAIRICRSAPSNRPPTWRKPLPPWKNSPPPSGRTPKAHARPINSPSVPPGWPRKAARSPARWSRP